MNEPSVLDYVKSIFQSRESFRKFVRAVLERRDAIPMMEAELAGTQPRARRLPLMDVRALPWLPLLVLGLVLFAQKTFEPPQQFYDLGIILYLAALGALWYAIRRGAWALSAAPIDEARTDPSSVRVIPLLLSLACAALAFYDMTGSLFTARNASLLVAALAFHFWAFWARKPRSIESTLFNMREFLVRDSWTLRITRWHLLALLVLAVSIFFHTYQLYSVAPEMTSDHAERLIDVYHATQGQYPIYFPRNTGSEAFDIYLSSFLSTWFGINFLTLKIVAALGGLLALPYIYLLAKEFISPRAGFLAVALAGFAYWPVATERFALGIAFYAFLSAAAVYHFLIGLRRQNRNDFLWAGLALGLTAYTSFYLLPYALLILFVIYFLHPHDVETRKRTLVWLGLTAFTCALTYIPLVHYARENPGVFTDPALAGISALKQPLWPLFIQNVWVALREFNWYDGSVWVFSVPGRPALDVICAALFLLGVTLALVRYLRERQWSDAALVLAVPLLQLPSILLLANQAGNPSLPRTAAALAPVFLLVALGLDELVTNLSNSAPMDQAPEVRLSTARARAFITAFVLTILFAASFRQNFDLVFNQYYTLYRQSAWNSREMGSVIQHFRVNGGPADHVWIVPYAYWVDTRLPGLWAGIPGTDLALTADHLNDTLKVPAPKLFIFFLQDDATRQALQSMYPSATLTIFHAELENQNFYVVRVPAAP